MHVTKRSGKLEPVNLNKITNRLTKLKSQDWLPDLSYVDIHVVAQKVVAGLYDGVTTSELDNLAAETAAMMSTKHPEYDDLAARITTSRLHKETSNKFSTKIKQLYEIGIISTSFCEYVSSNADYLDNLIDYNRDYSFSFFGLQTLKRAYLLKDKQGKIIERPQDMWLRVAAFIHQGNPEAIKETYELLSQKYFTHATPTLFNSGTIKPQLSSCFLIDIDDDSISGIYKTLSDCSKISQSAGGIGLSVHKIRSKGSYINGTNGTSNGIIPMLRVFDATARYVDQGGGKRKGSFAIYLEPWHSDIFDFLDLKKNTGEEKLRARDLFYALWVPDLFMQRVEEDGTWSLLDPKKAYYKGKALYEIYGDEFKEAYEYLEKTGEATVRIVKAHELWYHIIDSQIETGTPYILYKDSANKKSNQKNLGTIKSSNLCAEIIEYTSKDEIAVCNLASLALPTFLNKETKEFDYNKLYEISGVITENLNKVIDVSYYPVPEAEKSNVRHRPIGIGIQGFADLCAELKIGYYSEESKILNRRIFETIYKGAIDKSIDLARKYGAYESYGGSPASQGLLQFDLWGYDASDLFHNWTETKKNLSAYGLRNSLLIAPMPTASTSQILGYNECFEPFTSNLYLRRTLAGEFIVANRYLINDLIELGLWNEDMRQDLIRHNGSIQAIAGIPQEIKDRYKIAYEMSMRDIIDLAAGRGPFVCQSQSMNIFMENPTRGKLTSMHFYGWKKGLKTGSYYIRSQAARDAIKFTIKNEKQETKPEIAAPTCSIDDPDCESCSA